MGPTDPKSPNALRIDLSSQTLWRGEDRLDLAPKPWALLQYLVVHRDRLVTKEQLLGAVWPDTVVGEAVLAVAIRQLREALDDDARKPRFIETVHRRGYRWIGEIDVQEVPEAPSAPPALAEPPQIARPEALVGRASALDLLAARWSQALQGRRQIVFVTGEPGIGKTTVLDAFEKTAREHGAALVGRGQCLEAYGSSEAYLPVLNALDEILRGGDDQFATVLRRFAPAWFAQFAWLQRDGGPVAPEAPGGTRERMLRELAGALEEQSRERPIVLLLEDLHWADPSTVALLLHIGARRQDSRLLVLGTYRPAEALHNDHPLRHARQQMLPRGQCVEIPLAHLTRDDVRIFLEQKLDGAVAESAVSLLHERSNGNPLFLTHLLVQLLDDGALAFRRDAWRADRIGEGAYIVPAGLRDAVQQRLERLSPNDLVVMEAASVAGVEFAAAAVANSMGLSGDAIEEVCERWSQRADLLHRSGMMSLPNGLVTGRYRFTHALFQNVLYDGIAPARRAEMHARMGLWAERNGAGPGELAHHFTRTGSTTLAAKAIAYAGEAASRASALFAHEESVRHRAAALAVARWNDPVDPVEECSLQIELAVAQQRAGQIATAETTFHAAGAQARRLGRPDLLARAAIGCARGYPRPFADPVLIDLLEESLRQLPEEDHPLRAAVLAHLDVALASVPGGFDRRAALAAEAMAMSRRLDDPETSAWVIQCARVSMLGPLNRDAILAQIDEIDALLTRLHDAELELALRRVLIVNLIEVADMKRVDDELAIALRRSEEAQIPAMLWLIPLLRASVSLMRGEFESTATQLERAAELGMQTEHINVAQLTAGYHVALRDMQGRHAELEPLLRMALAQNPNVPTWRAVMAYLCSELGRTDEALEHFQAVAADGFAQVARDSVWLVFVSFAAQACHRLRQRDSALALYRQVLPFRDRSVGHPGAPPVGPMSRFLGLLADCAGLRDDAIAHFEYAMAVTERMGAWPWHVRIRLEYAGVLLEDRQADSSRKATALLEPALARATALGMDGWVPKIVAALDLVRREGRNA